MSAAPKPPPLPSRTSSTLSFREVVPVEKAIENLNAAAVELVKSQDHVTFSTVLDLHASTAFNRYNFADQNKFLQGLEVLFEKNSELASDIAWDAIPILLKFASRQVDREGDDAEDQKAVVVRANLLLENCANGGNSKEVFLVISGKIKNLDFRKVEEDSDSDEDDDDEEDYTPKQRVSPTALSTAKILLRLLGLVQRRLAMRTPSRFLATSLMSLLSMTTKAAKSLPTTPLCDIMDQIIEFVVSVTPAKPNSTSSDVDIPIQIKLIQAFITHGIEAFLRLPKDNATVIGWSSAWDKKARPERVVPKGAAGAEHTHPGEPIPVDNAQDKLAVGEVLVAFLVSKIPNQRRRKKKLTTK
ncbi:hypothetical protein ABW20_dc0109191 [Dactylellina cionopaga]|nr:hypothetical protein ABW20_dc0109191 [Dactylellina cionopaga]